MANRPSERRINDAVGRVCDLLTEMQMPAIDGEIALLQVIALSVAAKAYKAQAMGHRLSDEEAMGPYIETFKRLYALSRDELLERGPGTDL